MKDQLLPHLLISHPKICITHPLFLAFPKAVEKEICSMSYNAIYWAGVCEEGGELDTKCSQPKYEIWVTVYA